MKPLTLIVVISLVILAASAIAIAKPISQAVSYKIQRDTDSRAAARREALRHQAVMNNLAETEAATLAPTKAVNKIILLTVGAVSVSAVIVAIAIGGSIYAVKLGNAKGKAAEIKSALIYPDPRTGLLPIIPFVAAGKLRIYQPALNSVTTIHDQDIEPNMQLAADNTKVQLAGLLAKHSDYQDIDTGKLLSGKVLGLDK
jgi:hypothetical protein